MSIYSDFKPTYLYIKQHSITGKFYFGKTYNIRYKTPDDYPGSGTHWSNHIKKHGKEYVITLWYCLFYDKESIVEFALNFSDQQDIVKSEIWLNLKPENGVDGGSLKGAIRTKETKQLISIRTKGINNPNYGKSPSDMTRNLFKIANGGENNPNYGKSPSTETRELQRLATSGENSFMFGTHLSEETKTKIRISTSGENNHAYGKSQKIVICPHCRKVGGVATMHRWHFEKCSKRIIFDPLD